MEAASEIFRHGDPIALRRPNASPARLVYSAEWRKRQPKARSRFSARWFGAVLVACGLVLPTPAGSDAALPTVSGPIAATGIPGNPAHDYPFFAPARPSRMQNRATQIFPSAFWAELKAQRLIEPDAGLPEVTS